MPCNVIEHAATYVITGISHCYRARSLSVDSYVTRSSVIVLLRLRMLRNVCFAWYNDASNDSRAHICAGQFAINSKRLCV